MKQNMRKRTPLVRSGDAAIAQIEEEEGFRAEKYSSGGKWYIGYGTECDAEDYPEGITREEAELLLMSKVEAYEAKLNDFFDRYDVTPTQGQFDALICFSYNFGTGWMSGTSDLVKIARGEKDATRLEVACVRRMVPFRRTGPGGPCRPPPAGGRHLFGRQHPRGGGRVCVSHHQYGKRRVL